MFRHFEKKNSPLKKMFIEIVYFDCRLNVCAFSDSSRRYRNQQFYVRQHIYHFDFFFGANDGCVRSFKFQLKIQIFHFVFSIFLTGNYSFRFRIQVHFFFPKYVNISRYKTLIRVHLFSFYKTIEIRIHVFYFFLSLFCWKIYSNHEFGNIC